MIAKLQSLAGAKEINLSCVFAKIMDTITVEIQII